MAPGTIGRDVSITFYGHAAFKLAGQGVTVVIDPWLTSWYSAFAMNLFARGLNDGYTVGEAYEEGISHVGIEYLMDRWWWDIFENVVFFGDPNLKPFVPNLKWDRPEGLPAGTTVNGQLR